jgi:hypothetical protein
MIRSSRACLLIAAILLSACNAAISDRPIFSERQRSVKIVVADGIWLHVRDDCAVDRSLPKESWPKCAEWMEVKGNRIVAAVDKSDDQLPEEFLIVDGRPAIVQALAQTNPGTTLYGFMAFEPLKYGPGKRVIEARMWVVPCGTSTDNGASPSVTPFSGFSEDCVPQSVKALRRAAAKRPAQPDEIVVIAWTGPRDVQPTISSSPKK